MARCYAGTVMLEGTTLSEGRGTTRPLELFGAPEELAVSGMSAPVEILRDRWGITQVVVNQETSPEAHRRPEPA